MKFNRILAMTLVAVTCVSLTGCRQSDVIQELVDNVEAERTDQIAMNHTEDGEADENAFLDRASEEGTDPGRDARNEDAADRQEDLEQKDQAGEKDASDAAAKNGTNTKVKNGDSGSGGVSEKGRGEPADGAAGNQDNGMYSDRESGSSAGGSGDARTDNNSGSNADGSAGNDHNQNGNNSSSGSSGAPLTADDENARQIKDASGNEVFIPNNVSRVAAPGEAAVIAQMLGGADTLVATSGDFMDNDLTMKVFADELTDELVSVWEDEDDRSMSDSEFRTLLAADPDCVILISENTFTEAQQAELTQNSIGVVLLPKLSTTSNIKEAVTIVGQVLKNNQSSQVDSVSKANQYCDYMDGLIARVERNGNGFYSPDGVSYDVESGDKISFGNASASRGRFTVYIDDWAEELHYDYLSSNQKYIIYQDGIALSNARFTESPVYHYMTVGGVYNTTTDWYSRFRFFTKPVAVLLYEFMIANYYDYETGSVVNGSMTGNVENIWRWFQFERSGVAYHLGTEEFPAVIVKNKELKNYMENSKNSEKGMYRPADLLNTDTSDFSGLLLDDIHGEGVAETMHTDIWGDYDIYINPTGVGDWTGQSIEAVLETIWVSYKFYDEKYFTLSDVEEEITDFYQTFYRYGVTESDLRNILQLDEN